MDGDAECKSARSDSHQQATPRRDCSIIRGTLLCTHATLTNLPTGAGSLAASSMPYWRHIKGNSDSSGDSAIFLQSVVPIEQSNTKAVSIYLLRHAGTRSLVPNSHANGSAARRSSKRFIDLVVRRLRPPMHALDPDRENNLLSRPEVDRALAGLPPVLHRAIGAHKPKEARLAIAHGLHPSQLNPLNGSNQSLLAIGSVTFGSGSGFAACHQSSIRCLRSAAPIALKS